MKFILPLFLFTFCWQTFAQETKGVFIKCDVLGKKNEDVRYYHPVEGKYQVKLKNHYLPNKKELKALPRFVLINPQEYLKDSMTMVQANSLRHEIELDELIYVNWGIGVDSLNNQAKLDSFENKACYMRDEKYAGVVQDYFTPFLMSRFEITNAEYREFVDWVKDSIRREMIYWHGINNPDEIFTDEEMAKMLKHDDQYYDHVNVTWQYFDPSNKFINRGLFSLNFDYDYWKEIPHERIFPIIEDLTLRPNERWYKRRVTDVTKMVYRYYSSDREKAKEFAGVDSIHLTSFLFEHEVSIYPDTIGWHEIEHIRYNDPMTNMYFWHPAYDNYPVVGLSHTQIQAFIHWKQKKLKKEYPELMKHYELALPNLQEIEWSVNSASQNYAAWVLGDEQIVPDLGFGLEGDPKAKYEFLFRTGHMAYAEEVWSPFDITKKHKKDYFTQGLTEDGRENLAQIYQMRSTQNSLKNRIEFLSNNVSEWMDMDFEQYEKLLDAYINYNCFADIDYCQYQRPLDANKIARNDKNGKLIMGSNWYDERYESTLGVNTGGIYPKRFADKDSSFATVGFRLVLRLRE